MKSNKGNLRILIAVIFIFCTLAMAKHKPEVKIQPEPPSDLASRWKQMACAVVQISDGSNAGTGVFVSSSGDLLTAAHVVLDRSFSTDQSGNLITTVNFKHGLRYRGSSGEDQSLVITDATSADAERATADLALIKTGKATSCFIPLGDSDSLEIGSRVIAIGYPYLTPAGALYEGFVSSRYKHLPIPIGFIGSRPIYPQYDVLRLQMPITPGTSGSPVMDDGNKIVGIVSEVPVVWANDLSDLIGTMARQGHSGVILSGFDTTLLLAKLAWIVREFETPGAGLAVPVSYLKPPKSSN